MDYSLSGLKPFTSYTIRVTAENGVSDQVEGEETKSCEIAGKTGDISKRFNEQSKVICSKMYRAKCTISCSWTMYCGSVDKS